MNWWFIIIVIFIIIAISIGIWIVRRFVLTDQSAVGDNDIEISHNPFDTITVNNQTLRMFQPGNEIKIMVKNNSTNPVDIVYNNQTKRMTKLGTDKTGQNVWTVSIKESPENYIFKINDKYFGRNGSGNQSDVQSWSIDYNYNDEIYYSEPDESITEKALDTESEGQSNRYINTIYDKIFGVNKSNIDQSEKAIKIIKYLDEGAYPVKLTNLEIQSMRNADRLSEKNIALAKIKKYQKQSGKKLFTMGDL